MKKEDVKVGTTYLAKVSDRVVPVRIDRENARGGWDATNLVSQMQVRIKGVQRLRGPAKASDATQPEAKASKPSEGTTPAEPAKKQKGRNGSDAAAIDAATKGKGRAAKKKMDATEMETTAAEPKAAKAKASRPAKEKKVSGLDAAHQVLREAGEPMRCKEMVEKMLSEGLWKTGGKTPAATIYSAILREIATNGAASRFRKTDRGHFADNQTSKEA